LNEITTKEFEIIKKIAKTEVGKTIFGQKLWLGAMAFSKRRQDLIVAGLSIQKIQKFLTHTSIK
jgi:hypothetical protein